MTKEWNKCRKAAIACNKLEDSTVKYVASCKTGSSSLKAKLKALYQAKVSYHLRIKASSWSHASQLFKLINKALTFSQVHSLIILVF